MPVPSAGPGPALAPNHGQGPAPAAPPRRDVFVGVTKRRGLRAVTNPQGAWRALSTTTWQPDTRPPTSDIGKARFALADLQLPAGITPTEHEELFAFAHDFQSTPWVAMNARFPAAGAFLQQFGVAAADVSFSRVSAIRIATPAQAGGLNGVSHRVYQADVAFHMANGTIQNATLPVVSGS